MHLYLESVPAFQFKEHRCQQFFSVFNSTATKLPREILEKLSEQQTKLIKSLGSKCKFEPSTSSSSQGGFYFRWESLLYNVSVRNLSSVVRIRWSCTAYRRATDGRNQVIINQQTFQLPSDWPLPSTLFNPQRLPTALLNLANISNHRTLTCSLINHGLFTLMIDGLVFNGTPTFVDGNRFRQKKTQVNICTRSL